MNLDPDLQRILNVNAKVYNTKTKQQGKVKHVEDAIVVDYGNSAKSELVDYPIDEFKQMLIKDEIVSNSRLTMGSGSSFKVLPRSGCAVTQKEVLKECLEEAKTELKSLKSTKPKEQNLEVGYINFKTGKFSTESKRGYTKVEYRKATQKVTLEIDEDQLRKLKEMGLV